MSYMLDTCCDGQQLQKTEVYLGDLPFAMSHTRKPAQESVYIMVTGFSQHWQC